MHVTSCLLLLTEVVDVPEQQVYDAIIASNPTAGYFVDASTDKLTLFKGMTTLLSHPSQRPPQQKFKPFST